MPCVKDKRATQERLLHGLNFGFFQYSRSQRIEGILKGSMAVVEELRKLMKISQLMNSKGFEMQLNGVHRTGSSQ
jgi:hypothetical protein